MKSTKGILVWIAACAAGAAMAAFLIWAFAQPGTLGMYRWGYRAPVLGLIALGVLPLVAAAAARALKGAAGVAPKIATGVAYAASAVALLTALAVAAYVFSNAYGRAASPFRPTTIDPSAGLPTRAVAEGEPTLRIAVSSDGHYGRDASNAEARSAILRLSEAEYRSGRLDAFINLGDIVEMGMEADDWREAIESMRRDAPTLPFLALLGNHDALIGGYARWKAAFAPAGGRSSATGPSPSSWRLDAGRVHFIALDLLWGPEGFGAKEKARLSAQLEAIPPSDYIVVMSHCFFYSSGYVDEETGMAWYDHADMLREVAPLIAGKADLVISGHNHYMEWIEADGTAWAVVGALGGKPDPEPSYVSPGSVWRNQGVFGRLVLELTPDGLACEFQDQDGSPLFERVLR